MGSGMKPQHGFTLIELIMVMLLIGVLAVFVVPRLNTSDFESRGFHDETLALLRYAQKIAIAQRRTVCVALNSGGVALSIDTDTPPDNICNTGPALSLPSVPRGGSGLTGSVPSFEFTPLGSTPAQISISIAGSAGITVEAGTGYVH